MRKTKLILMLIMTYTLLLPVKSFAQATVYHPFPTDSAMWSSTVYNYQSGILTNPVSTIYKLKGDTLINGMEYSKIRWGKPFDYTDDSRFLLNGFLRTDSTLKKVYVKYPFTFYGDSSDILLYDFGATIGDSLQIKILNSTKMTFLSEKAVVESSDSFQTAAGYRKSLKIRLMRNLFKTELDTLYMVWVEGVGALHHPFYNMMCDGCYAGKLTWISCFFEKGNMVITNPFGACYSTPQSIKENVVDRVQIYPNPVNSNDVLTIVSPFVIQKLVFYNSLGQIVLNQSYNSRKKDISFSCQTFEKGVYSFFLFNEGEMPLSGKFLIK